MRSNRWESFYGITSFGESHGRAFGVVIEDVRAGVEFPLKQIQQALNARKPGITRFTSSRKESDEIILLSGVFAGKTTGMPICLIIENKNSRPEDYEHLNDLIRPGHADFSFFQKFKIFDHRGGGRASGRETISRVAAAELVNKILGKISIDLYPIRIGKMKVNDPDFNFKNDLSWFDKNNYNELCSYLTTLQEEGNSIGGIVEAKIQQIPAGLGDPVFEKLDANLAKAIISIGAVKGIEFGDGFKFAAQTGKEANDQMDKKGFLSNHSGGILGGISNGNELVFRFVVKPTPSIDIPQKTITRSGEEVTFKSSGRHDTCIIPRILPVAKAMTKLVLADAVAYQKLISSEQRDMYDYREAIDKIDEDILLALYRRKEISRQIGEIKRSRNRAVEDQKREEQLLSALKKKAGIWDIDEELIENIWKAILIDSKKMQ